VNILSIHSHPKIQRRRSQADSNCGISDDAEKAETFKKHLTCRIPTDVSMQKVVLKKTSTVIIQHSMQLLCYSIVIHKF
jgi:proteasome lid subunit RPN8/RPN11